jgi:hypothetical protein
MKSDENSGLSRLGRIHKKLLGRYHKKSSRFFHLIKGKLNWIIPALKLLSRDYSKKDKRLLLIWDLSVSPYAIGELLVLYEMSQILRFTHKIDKIDLAFVCDPKNPAGDYPGVTPENFYTKLPNLVSTIFINPHLGNFFIFDSNKNLEKFIIDNIRSYVVWPDFKKYISKNYPDLDNFDFIQKFYIEHGFIPKLDYRELSLKWAYEFYSANIFPKIPVVVHLRNVPQIGSDGKIRNADMEEWIKFFKSAEKKFKKIKFILIGSKKEIDPKFRNLKNLIIAKDYDTTAEQDLILAATSAIYLGTASGPMCVAWFSKKPYTIFRNSDIGNDTAPNHPMNYSFSNKTQILNWEPETEAKITKQFSDILKNIDEEEWKEKIKNPDKF